MSLGYVGFAQNGNVTQQSPAIWADCLNTILNDKGFGYYVEQDFLGNYSATSNGTASVTSRAPGILSTVSAETAAFTNAASGTYGPNVLSAATDSADNGHFQIYGTELGQIVRNSGRKFWFEARFAPGALNDSAFFIGLTTLANAVVAAGPIADNPSNSAAATLTSASFIGFVSKQASSALATVNAVYEKGTGTPVTVLADVTNASAFSSFTAAAKAQNSASVITQAAAVTAQQTAPLSDGVIVDVGNLTAAGFRKYGVRFDGYTKIEFYVDGVLVARQEVDSTVDQAAYYVPIVAVKTGTAATTTDYLDWIGAAYSLRS